MPSAADIIRYVERLSGHSLNRDEGVQHGDADRSVERVVVCWMATCDALAFAGAQGAQLVLAHESLYYPYDAIVRSDNPIGWQDWQTNRQRRELLDSLELVLLRVHGSLDEICIYDDFRRQLGLGDPLHVDGLARVFGITPCCLDQLVQQVKEATGMSHLRVCAPNGLDQIVRCVGLPWGGLGLFVNVQYQQRLIEMGCDVMIAGETDNYGFRFSAECGIPMIETGHEISENEGLKHFCEMLQTRFESLDILFYQCEPIWQMQ